jgi:hypothetical protein
MEALQAGRDARGRWARSDVVVGLDQAMVYGMPLRFQLEVEDVGPRLLEFVQSHSQCI